MTKWTITTSALLITGAAWLGIGPGAQSGSPGSDTELAFVPAPNSPIPVGPMAGRPAIGDCNGDGNPDIVIACGTCCGSQSDPRSGHIAILLGDGRGGFKPAAGSPIKIGPSVRKVALGDINGDGKLDAVAVEHDSYAVTVLLGDGTGRFRPAPGSPVQAASGRRAHTHDVVLADVNRDGRLDVLTTNVNDNCVSVLLGDAAGRFTPAAASPVPVGRGPYDSMAVTDLDGDDVPDLVTPNIGGNKIDVLKGDGKGGFERVPGAPYPVSDRPGYVVVTDVDQDGRPDILATHDDVGLLTILRNDGRGRFSPAAGSPLRLPEVAWGFAAADLDGNGTVDLAMGAMERPRPLVMLGDGKAGFREAPRVRLSGGNRPGYAVVADVDRDGRPDIIVGNYGSGDVSVFLNRRSPIADSARASDSPQGIYTATIRDQRITFQLSDKDKYTLTNSDGRIMVTGAFKVVKDEIDFTDDAGPLMASGTGKYKWMLADRKLTLTKVKDEADGRSRALAGTTWTQDK